MLGIIVVLALGAVSAVVLRSFLIFVLSICLVIFMMLFDSFKGSELGILLLSTFFEIGYIISGVWILISRDINSPFTMFMIVIDAIMLFYVQLMEFGYAFGMRQDEE